jgi:hypothetical protein
MHDQFVGKTPQQEQRCSALTIENSIKESAFSLSSIENKVTDRHVMLRILFQFYKTGQSQ